MQMQANAPYAVPAIMPPTGSFGTSTQEAAHIARVKAALLQSAQSTLDSSGVYPGYSACVHADFGRVWRAWHSYPGQAGGRERLFAADGTATPRATHAGTGRGLLGGPLVQGRAQERPAPPHRIHIDRGRGDGVGHSICLMGLIEEMVTGMARKAAESAGYPWPR